MTMRPTSQTLGSAREEYLITWGHILAFQGCKSVNLRVTMHILSAKETMKRIAPTYTSRCLSISTCIAM